MDERTTILICLGAATAANCVPCFEHYFRKAEGLNLTAEDIQEAVDLAGKVRSGAQIAMRGSIARTIGQEPQETSSCCEKSGGSCPD
jgi:alkylhydroperoxidase/carboxymuconolactone decarboxylase family protein YurZ